MNDRSWGAKERERTEAALRASEERLRKALSIETVGVLFFNLDGRMVDANPTFERMVGYSVEELRNTVHWEQFTPSEYRAATAKHAEELATLGKTAPYEKEFIRKDGSRFWGLFAPTVLAGHGTESECVEFIIDITERKRNEQALREADRRKDEFLAILAHELRNPLAPIRNGLELLERMAPSAPAELEVRSMMGRQLRHMVRLIDDLLDVSRINRGKIELRKERISLAEAVKQGVEAGRPLIDERGHELTLTLPEEPVYVCADVTRLSQVVANVLNNAAKYTPVGGRVGVRVSVDGAQALLSVSDTGEGIAPDMLGKVFDLFTQVDRGGARSHGGLGIGLSIVKGVVQLHGGSVSVRSAGVGKGSEFQIWLPLAEKAGAADVAPSASVPAIEARRVLVVDDNVDAANSLAQLFKLAGSEARVVYDGEEALAATLAYRPDVILLDIDLPKMNGYEICSTIRRRPGGEEPIIVALSGWGQDQDRRKSELAGFDAHLAKPADFADIARALQRPAR